MGYNGCEFALNIKDVFKKNLEIITRPRKYCWAPNDVCNVEAYLKKLNLGVVTGFKVQPKRWIVERTFAWIGK